MAQWYGKLGFKNYPLDVRSNPELIGVDGIEKRLLSYIEQGQLCLLCGKTGTGKTSMLQKLMLSPDLKGYEFIYISADGIEKDKDIRKLIREKRNLITRMFKKEKNMVILLDECQLASRILTESIKSRWNDEYSNGDRVIQSVIVSQIDSRLQSNFSGSFMDRLGKRTVRMKKLTNKELEQVLALRLKNGRVNHVKKFKPTAVKFLTKNCQGSVRQLLEYTDKVLSELHRLDEDSLMNSKFKISKEHVFNFLEGSGCVLTGAGNFQKLLKTKRFAKALEMFEQFGAMDSVLLAEKLDVAKRTSQSVIKALEKENAIMLSHTEDSAKFFIMTPAMKHEMVTL